MQTIRFRNRLIAREGHTMRFIPTLILAFGLLIGCQPAASDDAARADAASSGERYGQEISAAEVLSADVVLASAEQRIDETVVVEGTIREVCQNKGCWFIIDSSHEVPLRVHVPKDEEGNYVFTLPKDISGQDVIVEGRLFEKELDEAEQEHYSAEGQARAAAREYRIEASGVVVGGARG